MSAEVAFEKTYVGIDDTDERDAGKIEPLGDHLRADEHIDLAAGEVADEALVMVTPRHRVAVGAGDASLRRQFGKRLLHALRAQPG